MTESELKLCQTFHLADMPHIHLCCLPHLERKNIVNTENMYQFIMSEGLTGEVRRAVVRFTCWRCLLLNSPLTLAC